MMINISSFGKTPMGEDAKLYTIDNGKMKVSVSDFGARIVNICVPDNKGNLIDVALGFDSAEGYAQDNYIGATIGRFANRIENAVFTLDGKEYKLAANNGPNHLHGGIEGFDKKLFTVESLENSVKMSIVSPDMEEGFPGELMLSVLFTLTKDNSLVIEYTVQSNKDTVVNFTNHAYFNLSGAESGKTVEDHIMSIFADGYCETDKNALATGEIKPVKNTAMDFRRPKAVGDCINSKGCYPIDLTGGLDHNFVLSMVRGEFKKAAEIYSKKTGILMETFTDEPGVQIYSALHFGDVVGKGNVKYPRLGGICFETQGFPNATSISYFPTPVLKKDEIFYSKTEYKFSVR
ncbi:MAG: galactose mutarotase [Clostridia bacterium]|nr:galactose mutarotase [Clostridia bacterium]MBP3705799.1 galactose mutarotase [Clostridia bacterium]